MEQRLQFGHRPWFVGILVDMSVPPLPLVDILGYLFAHELLRRDESSRNEMRADFFAFVPVTVAFSAEFVEADLVYRVLIDILHHPHERC